MRKVLSVSVIMTMLFTDMSFALKMSQETLAPTLASSPILRVTRDEKGDPKIEIYEDAIDYWETGIPEGDIRHRWLLREIGLVLSQSLALELRPPAVKALVKELLEVRRGGQEVAIEGYDIKGIKQVKTAKKLIGYQIPIDREGEVAYYLRFSLEHEPGASSFTSVIVEGKEREVYLSVVPEKKKPIRRKTSGEKSSPSPAPEERLKSREELPKTGPGEIRGIDAFMSRDMEKVIEEAVHNWSLFVFDRDRDEETARKNVDGFVKLCKEAAREGGEKLEKAIEKVRAVTRLDYDPFVRGDHYKSSLRGILILSLLGERRFDLASEASNRCGAAYYEDPVAWRLPLYAEALLSEDQDQRIRTMIKEEDEVGMTRRPPIEDILDLWDVMGRRSFDTAKIREFIGSELEVADRKGEFTDKWTKLESIKKGGHLVTALWVLGGLENVDRSFLNLERIQEGVYVERETKALYYAKEKRMPGEYLASLPHYTYRNDPVREYFASAIGRAAGVNIAEVKVEPGRTFTKMSYSIDHEDLPHDNIRAAHSAAFALNVFLRRWDDSIGMIQRAQVGETFVGFDLDQSFNPEVLEIPKYIQAFNMLAALRDQRWKIEDIDVEIVMETVEKILDIDILQLAGELRQKESEFFEDEENLKELERCALYLKETQMTIGLDVFEVMRSLPAPGKEYRQRAREYYGYYALDPSEGLSLRQYLHHKGSPATLLREMRRESVYGPGDKKTRKELQSVRPVNNSKTTFLNEIRSLRELGIIEGTRTGYYLPEWARKLTDQEIEELITIGALDRASPPEEKIKEAKAWLEELYSENIGRELLDIIERTDLDRRVYLDMLSAILSEGLKGQFSEKMAQLLGKILSGEKEVDLSPEAAMFIRSFLQVYFAEAPIEKEKIKVSFVVSMFKEQSRIMPPEEHQHGEDIVRTKIRQAEELFGVNPFIEWNMIFVDDGERDPEKPGESSGEMVSDILGSEYGDLLASGRVKVIFLDRASKLALGGRKGSGVMYGLRQGLNDGADHLFYIDADISSHIGQSGLMLGPLLSGEAASVIASRRMERSVVLNRTAKEKFSSAVYNLLVRIILALRFQDTQTGFKAFSRECLEGVIPVDENWNFDLDFVYNFSFDTDLLRRIVSAYSGIFDTPVKEIPTVWIGSREESTVRFRDTFIMAGGLLVQRFRAFIRETFPEWQKRRRKTIKVGEDQETLTFIPAYVFFASWGDSGIGGRIMASTLMYLYLSAQKEAIVDFLYSKSRLKKWYSYLTGPFAFFLDHFLLDLSRFPFLRSLFSSFPGAIIRPVGGSPIYFSRGGRFSQEDISKAVIAGNVLKGHIRREDFAAMVKQLNNMGPARIQKIIELSIDPAGASFSVLLAQVYDMLTKSEQFHKLDKKIREQLEETKKTRARTETVNPVASVKDPSVQDVPKKKYEKATGAHMFGPPALDVSKIHHAANIGKKQASVPVPRRENPFGFDRTIFYETMSHFGGENLYRMTFALNKLKDRQIFSSEEIKKVFAANPAGFMKMVDGMSRLGLDIVFEKADRFPVIIKLMSSAMKEDPAVLARVFHRLSVLAEEELQYVEKISEYIGGDIFWEAFLEAPYKFPLVVQQILYSKRGDEPDLYSCLDKVSEKLDIDILRRAFYNDPVEMIRGIRQVSTMTAEKYFEWLTPARKSALIKAVNEGWGSDITVSYEGFTEAEKNMLRSGIITPVYARYYKMISELSGGDAERKRCFYLASGSDLTAALMVSGGAREIILADKKKFMPSRKISPEALTEKKYQYYKARREKGYILWYMMREDVGIGQNLLWELEAMQADILKGPYYDEGTGSHNIEYRLPGDKTDRKIMYFQVYDLTVPEAYPKALTERIGMGVDTLMMKAAQGLIFPPKDADKAASLRHNYAVIPADIIEIIINSAPHNLRVFADGSQNVSDVPGYFIFDENRFSGEDLEKIRQIRIFEEERNTTFGYLELSVMAADALENKHRQKEDILNVSEILNKAEDSVFRLYGRLKWIQNRGPDRMDFIALTRDWIDALVEKHPQAQELNLLISVIRRRCESMGITFIEGDTAAVKQGVLNLKRKHPNARGMVVTGDSSIEAFETFLEKIYTDLQESDRYNTIVAGVDTRNLTEGSYLALVEILEASAAVLSRIRRKEGRIGRRTKSKLSSEHEDIGLVFLSDRVILFRLPEAEPLDYESILRSIYRIQISA